MEVYLNVAWRSSAQQYNNLLLVLVYYWLLHQIHCKLPLAILNSICQHGREQNSTTRWGVSSHVLGWYEYIKTIRSLYACLFTVATLTHSSVVSSGVVCVLAVFSRCSSDLLDSHPELKAHFRAQTHSMQTLLNMQMFTRDTGLQQYNWRGLLCQTAFKTWFIIIIIIIIVSKHFHCHFSNAFAFLLWRAEWKRQSR